MRRKHHDLRVWQLSIELVKEIYTLTSAFPPSETYGLVSQMRRAAISVPSNIAEGSARSTRKELLHYLSMARGSLSELDTQLTIAKELGFTRNSDVAEGLVSDVFGLLGGLIKSKSSVE